MYRDLLRVLITVSSMGSHDRLRLRLASTMLERIRKQERKERDTKNPRGAGRFSGAYSGGKGQYGRIHHSRPVLSALQTSRNTPVRHRF